MEETQILIKVYQHQNIQFYEVLVIQVDLEYRCQNRDMIALLDNHLMVQSLQQFLGYIVNTIITIVTNL